MNLIGQAGDTPRRLLERIVAKEQAKGNAIARNNPLATDTKRKLLVKWLRSIKHL